MRQDGGGAVRVHEQFAAAADSRLDKSAAREITARADEQFPRAIELLHSLYGARADALIEELVGDLVASAQARPKDLRELDRRRCQHPGWFQDQSMIGYVCYVDRFATTLHGVHEHLDHLQGLGVRYLHLMPLLAPRPGDSDGGYAVADYDAVDPRLGTMADLSELASELHRRDIALCVDLVLNHTAREHQWAQAAMRGDAEHRAFYFVFPDRTEPDRYEQTLPDIFPQLAPGSFTLVPELDGWVWTTFRDFQWDLDYSNPAVFRAMTSTMLTLANRGPDVLRLDAVPFLWKQLGTDCQNLPQAHLLLQALRCMLSIAAPGVLLKAEAMVAPEILTDYLGANPDGNRSECDLAYDNQLMVMLWDMLATGSSTLARHALNRRPPAPERTSWVTYLRGHDDIGWAISNADAGAVGRDGTSERAQLSAAYSGAEQRWHSLGVAFQAGVDGAAPICGMTAALTGLQAARQASDDEEVNLALARIEALYSIVYSFGGIPLIYMGDEIGLGNDTGWADDPGREADNRWLHRPPMDWAAVKTAGDDAASVQGHLFQRFQALAQARARMPALAAGRPACILDLGDDGLFGYTRESGEPHRVTAVIDISGLGRTVELPDSIGRTIAHSGSGGGTIERNVLALPPYGFVWLTLTT